MALPWLFPYLEHLFDLLSGQVDIEFVQEVQDLIDAQAAIAVLISLSEGLLQPCDDRWVKESRHLVI